MDEAARHHARIAGLIAAAEQVADHHADDDPFSEWAAAANAITLARMPDGPAPLDIVPAVTCSSMLSEALSLLDALTAAQRRPSHSLDRVYVVAALARVKELEQ